MNQSPLQVLIVGCGQIAGGYDEGVDDLEFPCSHAGGYSKNKNFTMLACVEPDDSKRLAFMETWGVHKGFRHLEEVINANLVFDVISICSPTALHYQHTLLALRLAPKLIFCEKPITSSANETKIILERCNAAKVVLMVNYTRRWDPEISKLKRLMVDKFYGELRSVVGYYNKGIFNTGSHFIDLLHHLLGDLQVVAALEGFVDFSVDDPTISVLLQSEQNIPIHLVAGNAKDFALFEMQFIFANCILNMCESGIYWCKREIVNSTRFAGYRNPDVGVEFKGGYKKSITLALENIYQTLTADAEIACTGVDAYRAQVVCEKIIQLSRNYIYKERIN